MVPGALSLDEQDRPKKGVENASQPYGTASVFPIANPTSSEARTRSY